VEDSQFRCPRCGKFFGMVQFDGEVGWVPEPGNPPWRTSEIHSFKEGFFVGPDKQEAVEPGTARARRRYRQQNPRRRNISALLLASLVLAAILPLYPYIMPAISQSAFAADFLSLSSEPFAGPATAAPVPTATPVPGNDPQEAPAITPSATPTQLPTATPLPESLLIATAWQATLDQASAYSYAIQTENAAMYAATGTALPPRLTAMAAERAAGTQTAQVDDAKSR
jgi:hypothetical protein